MLYHHVGIIIIIIIIIVVTIIIITLFQEDNVFGTNVSLTYGPQMQRHMNAFDNYKTMTIAIVSNVL